MKKRVKAGTSNPDGKLTAKQEKSWQRVNTPIRRSARPRQGTDMVKRRSKEKPKTRVKAGTSKAAAAARKAAFIEAYVQNGGNATQAAITAGYSAKTADRQAWRLLKDVKIVAEIDERRHQALERAQERTELTIEGVLLGLRRIVHADPRKFYRPDGTLKAIHELDDDAAAAIASIEIEEIVIRGVIVGHTKKVKFWDKNAAIEKAMKYLGLFEKDNRQRNPLEGFSNDDARALKAWLDANRPPDPAPAAGH